MYLAKLDIIKGYIEEPIGKVPTEKVMIIIFNGKGVPITKIDISDFEKRYKIISSFNYTGIHYTDTYFFVKKK